MTVEEMRKKLAEHCENTDCDDCLLYALIPSDEPCTEGGANIPRNYEILFGQLTLPDNVNHPKHYETGKFECIDVMVETQGKEAVKAYCLCAAFKYLYRHRRKNGLEDIKKARWYLDKYVELEEGEAE